MKKKLNVNMRSRSSNHHIWYDSYELCYERFLHN